MSSAYNGCADIVNLLLKAGADVNERNNVHGNIFSVLDY